MSTDLNVISLLLFVTLESFFYFEFEKGDWLSITEIISFGIIYFLFYLFPS